MKRSGTTLLGTTTDFKVLFESVPGLYLILLPDLTIAAASDAYLSTTFTKGEEIIGKYLFDVFPDNPDDVMANGASNLGKSLSIVLNSKAEHAMATEKYDIRKPDGTFDVGYWSRLNKPVLNSNDQVAYIIHCVEDVTDFVLLQDSLKTSDKLGEELKIQLFEMESELFSHSLEIEKTNEELEQLIIERNSQIRSITRHILEYKAALDESCIVAITDKSGSIQHVNDNFCKISKYSKQELIGQDHRIVNSGHHPKAFIQELWETISSGLIWRGELKNRAKDGTYYWVDTTIVPFFDKTGKPVKYLSIRSDITSSKQTFEYLSQSRENYLSIFENSLVAMSTCEMKSMKLIEANAVAAELFGFPTISELKDNFDPSWHYVQPKDREAILHDLKAHGESKYEAIQFKKKDGTIFLANVYSRLNSHKSIIQSVLVDVTDQVRSQQELELKVKERTIELTNSLLREKEMNALKTRFVSFASHEFRTPLSCILSSASLIEMYKGEGQQEEREKHTQRIMASVNDLKNILDEFLSFMQLEKGTIDTDKALFNLPEFFREIVDEFQGMIDARHQVIEYQHNGNELIMQSKKILKHIILNLLSNASKYSMDDMIIGFHSSLMDGIMTITVKDQGIGIPEKDQPKLFTEFFRATNVENIQGTGLGLNIVKKYVELLSGTIDFVSKPGEGTTFVIQFPVEFK